MMKLALLLAAALALTACGRKGDPVPPGTPADAPASTPAAAPAETPAESPEEDPAAGPAPTG